MSAARADTTPARASRAEAPDGTSAALGITIDPRMLSTSQGRELAREPGAEPAACDWAWALSRLYLLAADRELLAGVATDCAAA